MRIDLIGAPAATLFPMARKPGLGVSSGFHHVLACGNRRATIFHNLADYHAYLERLERYRQRDGVTLHDHE